MARKKRKIIQPINEIEIFTLRTRKFRKINIAEKEIIVYNKELNEFQLLPSDCANYDKVSKVPNE